MIAPLALIGLISLPIIVAYYMLRLRRRDVAVGSTFLWQQLVRDIEANAPWQRLRFSWLLLLQLLIALVVVVAAARPFVTVTSDLAANVVLIVDTSASMSAIEEDGSRISLARAAARRVIGELPEGGHVTVVAADDSARVLVSETDDRAAALAAIDRIEPTQVPGDLTDAFALASALAARDSDSTVVVVTDANSDRLPRLGIAARIRVERVGTTDGNQAIAALSLLRRSGGAQLDLFVAVSNPSAVDVTRRLEIYADDVLVDARDMAISAEQRSEAVISSVPQAAHVVEARLAGEDALAVDDRAFALVPQAGAVKALLVSAGNTYLENALALLPRLELYAVGPAGYADAVDAAVEAGAPYGILIFDRFVPDEPPEVPSLYIGPGESGTFGTIGAVVSGPVLERTDPADPLLRFVDLATLHIGRARIVTLADGMRPVVETTAGHPLVAAGRVEGRGVALLAFALGDSDLPLQVAFPLLMSNLVDALLPATDGILPPSVELGQPIAVALDPAILRVAIVSAATAERIELDVIGGRVTVPGPRTVGLVDLQVVDDGTGEGGASLGETAANLFDPGESRVTPGDPLRISDLGRVDPAEEGEPLSARSEWWWPLALGALVLLLAEWLIFHRPTRRALARLLRRGGRPGACDPEAGSCRHRHADVIPVAFTDPIWLWLALPAALVVVMGWWAASRTLPRIRRVASLVIRLVLVGCIVASLAGARLALPSDRLSVVFLVDASASMVDATREELLEFATQAVREIPEGDTAGVVVFGANALVDRLPSGLDELQEPASRPVVGATDIAAAVRLATAIFPAGTQQRIVLLSDGNDTGGQAAQAILSAAERGVRLDVVLAGGAAYPEALVDGVDAPAGARVGETVELTVRVRSTVTTDATLRLLADGATVATRQLSLEPGTVSVAFSIKADEPGFHVFRAVLEPEDDHFTENNAADAYLLVTGEPQILLATDDTVRAADLVEALVAARQNVTVVPAGGVPSSLATLAGYDAVILDNVSAAQLGTVAMASLQVYVRDLGKGLVMLGGRNSYGAGGYLNSTLEEVMPVYMTVRDRDRSPDVALVAVVDKSGSMADCHCTSDTGGGGSGTRGFEKVDIAKEAILRAADALSPTDQLGVVAFDEGAHWAMRTGPIDVAGLQSSLGFQADGQTNIYAGLKAAYDDLVRNPAKLRHIILITDGWSQSGAYDALLADMQAAGITLSTIGTGGGSADILRRLAEQSGGRYYNAPDATTIPDIFLKETIRTAGEQIVEEQFQPVPSTPSEILRGLDASRLPSLLGYNATTAKGTATVALLTARDDPLLAQWQYGLGRAVAWTSDARQQWATPWIGTESFGTLTAQLVAWTLPPKDEQGIDVRFSPGRDGALNVEVTSLDDDGTPRNFYRTVVRLVGPDLEPLQTVLTQVGPGRYAGSVRADDPGAYLVRVAQTREGADSANRTLGVVSPAAEEFRRLGVDTDALAAYATAGRGRQLTLDAEDPEVALQVWTHDIDAAAFPTPIWPWLLLLAMALVPIDVGVRRVALTRGDFVRARGWVARRVGLARPAPEVVPGLAELRAAKGRSERRADRAPRPAPEAKATEPTAAASGAAAPARAPETAAPATPTSDSADVPSEPDSLAARLARQRRRR